VPEIIELKRDCAAIAIPSGQRDVLRGGTPVRVMQSRGGSYTVATPSSAMFRIDAVDADALGFVPAAAQGSSQPEKFSDELVWKVLKTVYDPEIPIDIVDLGLVYACKTQSHEKGHSIEVQMTMTAPGCGMGNVLKADVEAKLARLPEVANVEVKVVFDPPWTPSRMSEAARLQLGLDMTDEPSQPLIRISYGNS
jgi:probable FeS assembly SUF system protein SufT